jgi:serine/threonine protein kinase
VRDRAIVSVDPPTQLDGRWAVIMEYVDGWSCARVLRAHGAMPTRAAVEVIMEVARALHTVWFHPGPDGRPLHLIHRDLKPENIQITPSGEVKVLDFGLAKANFDRQAATTEGLVGTLGYVAPERFEGQEGDRTDIYSLGVVLRKLLGPERPEEDGRAGVVALIALMTPSIGPRHARSNARAPTCSPPRAGCPSATGRRR